MLGPALMMAASGGYSGPSISEAILDLSVDLLGYWKLDETSGTTATDSSGGGKNGTYGGTGYTLSNVAGGDGVDYVEFGVGGNAGYVEMADHIDWSNLGDGMTIFALVKPDSVVETTRRFIVAKGNTSNYEYGFEANGFSVAGGLTHVMNKSGGAVSRSVYTNSGVLTTGWNAVVGYAAIPDTDTAIDVYLNSTTALSSVTKGGDGTGYANGTAALRIGWRANNPSGLHWDGGMAHVAIFNGLPDLTDVFAAAEGEGWY